MPHLAWQTALPSLENPRHFFIPLKDDSAAFLLPLDHEFLEGRGCVSPDLISWGPSKIPSTERHPDKSSLNGQIHEREIDCTFSNALCHQCPPFIHCQAAPQVDIMEPTQETVVRRGSRESPESPGKASLVLENMLSHVLRSRKRLGQFLPLWKTPSHSELEHWRDGAAPAALSSCPEGKSLFG